MTDMPLDDNFDAATVTRDSEIYRMWEDDSGSAYDAVEYARQKNAFKNVYGGELRARRNSESLLINTRKESPQIGGGRVLRDNESERGSARRGLGKAGGTQGRTELVETRILEDGPQRTISVWRELVADSSHQEKVPHVDIDAQLSRRPSGHRRTVSGNLSHTSGSVISRDSRAKDVVRTTGRPAERGVSSVAPPQNDTSLLTSCQVTEFSAAKSGCCQ